LLDQHGHIVGWNRGAELINGYQAGEIMGRHISCLYPADDVLACKPEYRLKAAAQSGRFEEIGERVRKDGSRFVAHVVITAIFGADRELLGFGKIVRDISERTKAETLVKATEARRKNQIDSALNRLMDGLITFDHSGIIQSYNKACARLFGYTSDEVLGKNLTMLMPESHHTQHGRDFASYLQTRAAQIIGVGHDVMGQRKDGSTFLMELAAGDSPQNDNQVSVAIIRDLTERREADKQRNQLQQAQKMEAVGQLTGGMAHDFNNLLGVIIGNLDILRETRTHDPMADELVCDALDAALRGADLTRRLLAFARQQPLRPERSDINEMIVDIVKLMTRTLGENITIELTLASDVWPVQIDRAQFDAAIANLATNARDAMPHGGTLLIATHNGRLNSANTTDETEVTPGDYVVVEVCDSGSGMPPEVVRHIFEPFFTTKETGKGTGLGLSMVFGFMKQSGGHFAVQSEPDKGTTIRLYLPRSVQTVTAAEEQLAAMPSQGGNETILVVEDNAGLRRVLLRQLSTAGYRVMEASDAEAAMAIIEGPEPVHLLLTDIVMQGKLDGRDLVIAAVARRPLLRALMTSGFPSARLGASIPDKPRSQLLSKPYRKEELRRMVREALDGPPQAASSETE
jgi:PAS domain S-box-containing protein